MRFDLTWMEKRSALAVGIFLPFCIITFWNFNLPGLHFDEAVHAAYAPGIRSASAAELYHYRLPDNILDSQDGQARYPILGDVIYTTMLTPYLALPVFTFLGFSQASMRLFEAALGFSGILAGVFLVRRLFGNRAAWLLGLLAVLDPINVFLLRSQNYYVWYCILFPLLAVHCLLRLHPANGIMQGGLFALAAGVFLGLAAGAYFIGFFISLPLAIWAVLALWGRWRAICAFIAGGALGYAPVLYAFWSIYLVDPSVFETPYWAYKEFPLLGAVNFERWTNLLVWQFGQFKWAAWIVGNFQLDFVLSRLLIIGFLVTTCGLLALGIVKSIKVNRIFFALTFAIAVIYGIALFFIKGTNVQHTGPLLFLVYLQISAIAGTQNRIGNIAFALCLALALHNGIALFHAQNKLEVTRGNGYSNESYSLPADLARNNILKDHHIVFTFWGLHAQFLFLTNGSIPYHYIHGADADRVGKLLKQFGKLALFVTSFGNNEGRKNDKSFAAPARGMTQLLGHVSEEKLREILAKIPARQTGELTITGKTSDDVDYKILFLEEIGNEPL